MDNKVLGAVSALGVGVALAVAGMQPSSGMAGGAASSLADDAVHFTMKRSAGVESAGCLTDASAKVTVKPGGIAETMTISAKRLPPNREFDVFVTQLPNAPFGVSWYQGDLESDAYGNAHGRYVGRFNVETFAIAPGVGPAPVVFDGDGSQNVASPPIHTYHVGIWFGSPEAAAAAGCPATVTPFNGEHNAGIQALSTRNFGDLNGPLRAID